MPVQAFWIENVPHFPHVRPGRQMLTLGSSSSSVFCSWHVKARTWSCGMKTGSKMLPRCRKKLYWQCRRVNWSSLLVDIARNFIISVPSEMMCRSCSAMELCHSAIRLKSTHPCTGRSGKRSSMKRGLCTVNWVENKFNVVTEEPERIMPVDFNWSGEPGKVVFFFNSAPP